MDVSAFLTQQAASNGKGAAPAHAAANGKLISAGDAGLNFMDLIFARLIADTKNTADTQEGEGVTAGTGTPLQNQTGATDEQSGAALVAINSSDGNTLSIEQLLKSLIAGKGGKGLTTSLSPEELSALKEKMSQQADAQKLPLDKIKKKLEAIINSLLAGIPQDSKQEIFKLSFSKDGGKDGAPALIATGLTPEQLTKILKDIADGNEDGQAFIVGIVQILPQEAKKEAVFLPRGIVVVQSKHPAGDIGTPQASGDASQTLAGKLTALTSGKDGDTTTNGTDDSDSDFDGVLRMLARAQTKGEKNGQQGNDNGITNAMNKIRQHMVSPGLSTIQGKVPAASELTSSFTVNDGNPDGLDYSAAGTNNLNVTSPIQLTSMVTHVQQAGMPHPATQMVASVIAKAATNGESRNITLQLDPPDLGKVSVKLEFHKDGKLMKAHIVAEKPETYLMLQRDAHVLQRSLHDTGVSADGGLSFELSQDGNMFGQDQHSTGGNSGGGSNSGSDAGGEDGEMNVIEARMDWYIDPDTGAMRYDALV